VVRGLVYVSIGWPERPVPFGAVVSELMHIREVAMGSNGREEIPAPDSIAMSPDPVIHIVGQS
jgi:hypothetical protein